ncbi:MAG: hypothetical protein ACR2M5_16725 [Nakamurella sp.]
MKWWPFHRPSWDILASWERPDVELVDDVALDHPAVRDAAMALNRPLP